MNCIKKAGVLGAGVMGATIAAHLANAGLDVLLLDIVPRELTEEEKNKGLTLDSPQVRNRIAQNGLDGLLKMKPAPFLLPEYAKRIEIGNFADHAPQLQECDWVIEVVVENMNIKKRLFSETVAPNLREGAVLSTNTSGLSVNEMATALPPEARKNFMVTHFFNPPRYMRLMEVVGCNEADPDRVKFMADFITRRLGKGVVMAKDTPNFIGNRIGVYAIFKSIQHMMDMGMSVEEVDAVAGKATARPKSAAFRTADLVGLDTLVHVGNNSYEALVNDEERDVFKLPDWVQKMVENNQLGNKTRQGFYKKEKTAEGTQVLYWDYEAGEYKPSQKPKFESIKFAKMAKTTGEQLKAVINGQDKAADFAWRSLRDTLLYSYKRIPEIAEDVVNIDNAMKWGFNWDLGPFEMFDAIGIQDFVQRAQNEGMDVPEGLKAVPSFYKVENGVRYYFDLPSKDYKPVPVQEDQIELSLIKSSKGVVESCDNASIVDIGDGVFCLEFHSPQNSISDDILDMVFTCVQRAENEGTGIVLGNQGERFSVGANLFMLAVAIAENKFEELEATVKKFQDASMALKYAHVPVVAAPYQMALGGGCEFCLHADAINAHVETYMGLVEMGVGLLPAGGGTKELCVRAAQAAERFGLDVQPLIFKYFENIAMAKVSMGADEAFGLGYMTASDAVSMDIGSLLGDAKSRVLSLAKNYRPRKPAVVKAPGRSVAASVKSQLWNMKEGSFITEYEYEMGSQVADVITGGDVDAGTLVTEQYILDIERAAFVRLCRNQKTVDRINHMLKTNKPLRN
ncbi:MAG: 3-hydroxyacyl-CoA dehydrogenase/enoyl-CoA hydratase family protein [Desulfovermiculus sp.]